MNRRARIYSTLAGLALAAAVAATGAAAEATYPPQPPIPCEWWPVTEGEPEGPWYQPLPADECPEPYENAPAMTLPPTDTAS